LRDFYEFEVGTSHALSIREFVELAKKISGNTKTSLNFGAIPYRENEVMDHKADISGISRLGWKCTISPAEGLKKMFESEKQLINHELS
jgi:nucleoside-diphosphate-sugar epimerase